MTQRDERKHHTTNDLTGTEKKGLMQKIWAEDIKLLSGLLVTTELHEITDGLCVVFDCDSHTPAVASLQTSTTVAVKTYNKWGDGDC